MSFFLCNYVIEALMGTDPEFSQYKAQPEVEIKRLRQCLAGCNSSDCKITCSAISQNLFHRLKDTPVEPGWVCHYIGASTQPALGWNHCWLCTTQPAAPACWWLAGPGCKPGAPPNQIISWGSAVLRSSGGVFSPPWCYYPT